MHPRHGMMTAKRNYETAFPDMTSNTLPAGYVASASHADYGSIWKAFDGVYGATDGTNLWGAATDVCWLQIQFPTERFAIAYSITNRGSAGNQNPTEWQLLGSMDGSAWTTLDSRTAQTPWPIAQTNNYTITTPGAYLYYRLNITDNVLNSGVVAISELDFTFITS